MSNDTSTKRGGGRLLVLILGIVLGGLGAVFLPSYLPEGPWKGISTEGTVLDVKREEDRLLMRVSTDQGLMLATFSQKQDDIELLVQPGDRVTLGLPAFAPFVQDPTIQHVTRGEVEAPPPTAAGDTPRQRFLERMEARLDTWQQEIDQLREGAADLQDDARESAEQLVADLEERSAAARQQLDELRESSDEAWKELRTGIVEATEKLEAALEAAKEELKR